MLSEKIKLPKLSRFNDVMLQAVVVLMGVGTAQAQQVTITGSNGQLSNGCNALSQVPNTCATQVRTAYLDSSGPALSLPQDAGSGLLIGTNLSDSNTGAAASGTATVIDGGTVTGAYLYAGFEKNTAGAVTVSGAGSTWSSYSAASIGHGGNGTLAILDGGRFEQLQTDYFFVGYEASGKGTVTVSGVNAVSGQRSSLITKNRMYFGRSGEANINILNGGFVSAEYTSILAELASSNATLTVSGVHQATGLASTFKVVNNQFWVGDFGNGTLNILNGGVVEVNDGIILAGEPGGTGVMHVDGVDKGTGKRSTSQSNAVFVGNKGDGALSVTNGGLVKSNTFYISLNGGAHGEATVDGAGSEVIVANESTIGHLGSGTLNLSEGGLFKTSVLLMASGQSAEGTLNIGTGGKAGIIDVAMIEGKSGKATVNFNHVNDIDFAPKLTGNLAVNKVNLGTTTVMGSNDYTGQTTIKEGTFRAGGIDVFSKNSNHIVEKSGIVNLGGFNQTMKKIDNAGTVRFGGNGGTTLNLADTYAGNGGVLEFSTVLGGDASLTDTMVVDKTTGTSFVKVNNINGQGAHTAEGIRLIGVKDSSDGAFNLRGNYIHKGQQVVVGGAYAYSLHQGNASGTDDKGWYLRSEMISQGPRYQAGVPVYEVYPQVLLGLNGLATLQQRSGNRMWSDPANAVVDQGLNVKQADSIMAQSGIRAGSNGVWGRIEGEHNKIDPRRSTSNTDHSQNISKMQIGLDAILSEKESATLIGGIYGQYVHGNTTINSFHGDGTISTDGYGLGGTLTWYDSNGIYIDAQAQVTWYRSDLSSATANTNLANGNRGFGYALSTEIGKRFAIDSQWSVTPQMQLVYSHVHFDRFNDTYDASVSLDKGDSLQGRVGIALNREVSWQNAKGLTNRALVYGIANIDHEFLSGTQVTVASKTFVSQKERLWGGVGLGSSYSWDDGRYMVYGEGLINTSLNHFGDSYALKANVGFRMKW